MINNCRKCKHSRRVAGNTHIQCIKPDPKMTGNKHGIEKGWFYYPVLFDPVWATKECDNFERIEDEANRD